MSKSFLTVFAVRRCRRAASRSSKRPGFYGGVLAALVMLGTSGLAQGQTVFTYSSTTTNGNWSTPANWNSTTYPGASGAGNTDTANLINTDTGTSNFNVNYDSGASGSVGTINLETTGPTSGVPLTSLTLGRSLTINTALTMYSQGTTASSSANRVYIQMGTNNLTINQNATFTIGGTAVTNVAYEQYLAATATTVGTAPTITINGTFLLSAASMAGTTSATTYAPGLGSTASAGNGSTGAGYNPINITIGATGTFNIDSEASGGIGIVGTRGVVTGNFTTVAGATLKTTAGGTGSNGANAFYLGGVTNTIAAGTNFVQGTSSAFGSVANLTFIPNTLAQTTTTGTLLPAFSFRDINSGTAGSPLTTTETFSSTATSTGITTGAMSGLTLYTSGTNQTAVFQLASNLNLVSGTPFSLSFGGTVAGIMANVDLAGFSYNAVAGTSTTAFAPTGGTVGGSQLNIINSGASSYTNGQGLFQAARFGLNASDTGIGSGVILVATGTGTTNGVNDLGTPTNGVTTINAASTFYYVGAGTGTLASTNNRSIGLITVGTGSYASTLNLASAITAQGLTTVNTSGVLDTVGHAYTTTGLVGAGTIQNGSTATAAAAVTLNATGTNTFLGSLTDSAASSGNTISVTLSSTSTGTQILSGANSYHGATAINGGTLLITGTSSGGGPITVGTGGKLGGAAGTVTASGVTLNSGGGLSVSGNGTVTPGVLTVVLGGGTMSLTSIAGSNAGELVFVLNTPSTSDRINLTGTASTLTIGTGTLNLADFTLTAGASFGGPGTYVLFDTASPTGITGSLASSGVTGTLAGYRTTLSESFDGGGNEDLILNVTAVPEPSGVAFAGAALALFAGRLLLNARRRRAA